MSDCLSTAIQLCLICFKVAFIMHVDLFMNLSKNLNRKFMPISTSWLLSFLFLALPCHLMAQNETAQSNSEVQKAFEDSTGVSGTLKRLGLKNVEISGAEAFIDFNKNPDSKGQLSTDGPTLTIQAEVSKDLMPLAVSDLGTVTISTTLMTNELAAIDQSKLKIPIAHGEVDWGHFFREAKIVLDVDPKSGALFANIIKTATLGIQDIESDAFDSKMPIPDNGVLRGITRQRSAQAIRIDLTSKILDSLAIALFETGVYHPENFGDNRKSQSPGAVVMMTKNFSDRLRVSGSLTKIDFPDKAEIRINTGIAYENKEGGFTVFYNRVDFRNNPLYTDATVAQTVGIVKKIYDKHSVTAEATRLNNGYNEYAVGYIYNLTKRTSFGAGLRNTPEGLKVETRAAYSFGK